MVRFSKEDTVQFLFYMAMILLLINIFVAAMLSIRARSDCEKLKLIKLPFFASLIILFLATFVAAYFRLTWLCLAAMFLFILLVFSFTVFAFLLTNKGAGRAVWGRGYKEYRLGDYSNWLQNRVVKNSSNWNKIKSCLQDTKVCNELAYDSVGQVAEEFYQNKLSPIQYGCCKPPSSCSFVYVNATYWTSRAGNFTDMDCNKWSNDEDEVCYNCDSCKAGVLANVKHDLRVLAVINIMMLFLMLLDASGFFCGM